ncbi:hypothetical protein MNBD_GAMMA12-3239 [hydrothermal vent metagenome]|uniref:YbjN domain-containing protein n=1 Tax=hydrothermal vent metagenome TaxID=652676 RepID=A0A3B0YDI2_9ZZZZ
MNRLFLIPLLFFVSNSIFSADKMTQANLEKIIKSLATKSKGNKGVVAFTYKQVNMLLVSNVTHNRMRIISPVIRYKKLSRQQLDTIMQSNYHKSLDARYAVSNGILYSAYIHPLKELSITQIKSALIQVANLAISFGKQYSSGVLKFGNSKKKTSPVKYKL